MTRSKPLFTWTHYLIRLAAALVLVFATYNPSGWSYVHWVEHMFNDDWSGFRPLMALGGILLVIGWAIFIRATMRSLGSFGTFLAIAFFAIVMWLLVSWIPHLTGQNALVYLLLIGISGVISIGISWSHIRRRMTGQFDVDEADI